MARHTTLYKSADAWKLRRDELTSVTLERRCASIELIYRTIFPAPGFLRNNPAQRGGRPAWQQFHSRPGSALLQRIIGVTGFSPAAVNRGGK
jgi:hypothetical protein